MVRVRYSFGSRHTRNLKNIRKQKKKFLGVVEEVILISDIILEVLDARFINETRNREIEKFILEKGKKIIYVLNKADLIDTSLIEKKIKIHPFVFVSCTERKGSVLLRNMIKKIIKQTGLSDNKKRAQVGIIGYPNTGKSSLINILTGKNSAKTANQPGFTKGMQKIRLTKDILLLDSPGVITSEEYSTINQKKISSHTKVGARSYSIVSNPEFVVQDLLNDLNIKKQIESFYSIETNQDSEILLEQIGRKRGFLKKGGEIDIDRCARAVLKDWQEGKISKNS